MAEALKPPQGGKSVNQAEQEARARGDKVVTIGRREFIAGGIIVVGTAAAGFFGIRKALDLIGQNRALQQEINALKQNPSSPPQPSTENLKTVESPKKRFEAMGTGHITYIIDEYKKGGPEQQKEIRESNPEIISAYEEAQKARLEAYPILKDNGSTPHIEDIGIDVSAIKDIKGNRIYAHWILRDGNQEGQRNTIFIPKTQGEEKSVMKVSVGLPDDLKSGFVQHPSGEVTATIFHWTPTNNNGVFNELLNGEVTASKADASYKQFQKPLDYTAIKEYPTFIMLLSDKLPPVKQGEGNIKFEEIKPLKKLTAETKEITEDMIKPASSEQITTLQDQARKNGENKIPAPVKGRYGEYELVNGVRGITVTLSPGVYTIWTFADDEVIIRPGEFSDTLLVTPKNTKKGSSFFRVFYNFPRGTATFPEKEIINNNTKQLATIRISSEDNDQLKNDRLSLLKYAKDEISRNRINQSHFVITASNPSGGLNKEPILGRIFLTDSQNQVLSLHSGK